MLLEDFDFRGCYILADHNMKWIIRNTSTGHEFMCLGKNNNPNLIEDLHWVKSGVDVKKYQEDPYWTVTKCKSYEEFLLLIL